jgi:hypothetical protein
MPNKPRYEDVRDWYQPFIRYVQQVHDHYDVAFIGAVEGPITDAYTFMDMELFALAIYDAPELVSHIMDCTGLFSAYIARAFAEVSRVPLLFMGEDISGTTGPIFNPKFVRKEGLPRWQWITTPIKEKGMKFLYHTDGRYGKFLPLIFDELAADGVNPIERNNCNDIFENPPEYPHKLFGNVCCIHTRRTAPSVMWKMKRWSGSKARSSGWHFYRFSSEVHDAVPVECGADVSNGQEYGHYPIDVDCIRSRRRTSGA